MDEPRTILLRRPPVCSVVDEPYVPNVDLEEVAHRWRVAQTANPALFDGRVLHVLGVHRNGCGGATINLVECAYRFYAVQDDTFDCGIRPLGVKGITVCDSRVLWGRRAAWVHQYPGEWEFAPGGCVEPGSQPEQVLQRELAEETGCVPASPPVPLAILQDTYTQSWELIYRVTVEDDCLRPGTDEYSDLRWCAPTQCPSPRSAIAQRMESLPGASAP
jgi:8-oxo-dGTP pyrophosphatase MutT (NUDIX family)